MLEIVIYQLDKVWLIPMKSLGSGFNLFNKSWTVFFAGTVLSERRWKSVAHVSA